ncbi:methyltransferase family protein [Rhizobium sp. PP-F2F-G38]|nr:methyltransferase family protein [Rhizobium sp. PP-F2F-G38]
MNTKISVDHVREKYNPISRIWDEADYWHFHLYDRYRRLFRGYTEFFGHGAILNIGSASEDYGLNNPEMVHLDAAENSLPRNRIAVCGDAHHLPFGEDVFEGAFAIGSVLNYCSPLEVFTEIARVTKPGSYFAFDFEQSGGYEHWGTAASGKNAFVFHTDFNDLDETIWVYSRHFIESSLAAAGFRIAKRIYLHVMTSAIYRATGSNTATKYLCKYDHIAENIPLLRQGASTVLILAVKADE